MMSRRVNLSLFNALFRTRYSLRQSPLPTSPIPFTTSIHTVPISKFPLFPKITNTHFAIRHNLRSFSDGSSELDHNKEVDTINLKFGEAATLSSPITQSATSALSGGPLATPSLYIGDLEGNVNEGQLYDLFSKVAQVVSVKVYQYPTRPSSFGFGFVNFANAQDAANAKELLNFTVLNGKPIQIMFSRLESSIPWSGRAKVFIKNLDTSIDNKALHDTFAAFGTVLSWKVAVDSSGRSRGYGYVQFDNEEAAQNAIKQLNGMLINDKQVDVELFVPHQERAQSNRSPDTRVYVKNFSETFTDDDMKQLFGPFGTIISATVVKDVNGKSRCFGFVEFKSPDSAAAAIERLNGTTINDDKVLCVKRAQSKEEREAELKANYERLKGAALFLRNLDHSFSEEKLKALFSDFGTITYCKVKLDLHGRGQCYGLVAFSTPEEASKALNEMNAKLIGRKHLHVMKALSKEERKARSKEERKAEHAEWRKALREAKRKARLQEKNEEIQTSSTAPSTKMPVLAT